MSRTHFATGLLVLIAFVALLLPAAINRHPILFADSAGYFRSGSAALDALHLPSPEAHKPPVQASPAAAPAAPLGDHGHLERRLDYGNDGITTDRSVYYGVFTVVAEMLSGQFGVPLFQALLTVAILLVALRRFGIPPLSSAAIAALLSLGTGLAIFTSTIMPDLYAAFCILAAAILVSFWRRMSWWERGFWILLAEYSLLVHKGHVLVLLLLTLVAAALQLARKRFDCRPFTGLIVMIVLALAAHAAVGVAVKHMTGEKAVSRPFLLARMVGDGAIKPYLDEECGRRHYALCAYKDRLPMTENQFLWGSEPGKSVYATAGPEERARLSAEANKIVLGAASRRPLQQVAATLLNVGRMGVLVGVTRYAQPIQTAPDSVPGWESLLRAYHGSPVATGKLSMFAVSDWMLAVYLLSLGALAWLAWRTWSKRLVLDADVAAAATMIVTGVFLNAAVFGALSSAADRYQGRVAWLVPFVVFAAFWSQMAEMVAKRWSRPLPRAAQAAE